MIWKQDIDSFVFLFPIRKSILPFLLWPKIVSILKRKKINLVQTTLPTCFGWQTLRGARKLGIPVVLGFHVQTGNVIPPYPLRSLFERVLETWFSYFYKRGDIIVTPSSFAGQILKKYTHKPIRVVSNGIDLKRFDGRRVSSEEMRVFRKKYSLDEFLVLLYVGRLSYEKNINHLLKIMQSLKRKRGGVKLLLVGEGGLRNKLKRRSMNFRASYSRGYGDEKGYFNRKKQRKCRPGTGQRGSERVHF